MSQEPSKTEPARRATAIRQAIRAGGRDVTFTEDPDLEAGQKIVLLNSKTGPRRWVIVERVTPPPSPPWWVRNPPPPLWTVRVRRYELAPARFLRTGPLPHTEHDLLRRDQVKALTPDEIERAAQESGYRSSGDPLNAGECVGEGWLRRFADEAKAKKLKQRRSLVEGR